MKTIWGLKKSDMLSPKLMLSLLVVLGPREFSNDAGSTKQLIETKEIEDPQVLDEILFQMKAFFIARNLDGKSLFRVLVKNADP